jgi:hypothetical protein
MTIPVFQATIVNGSGDVIPTPQITVLEEPLGTPATLFSDRDGLVPLGVNGVFSGDADGFAQFFAAAGNYRVTAYDSGSGFTKQWDYVVLTGTAAEHDVQSSPTDATAEKVLTVGAFGLGAFIDQDYNAPAIGGSASSSPTNGPAAYSSGLSAMATSTQGMQIAGDTNGGIYARSSSVIAGAAWQPVYTGTNYQPETPFGIGVVRLMKNVSGGSFSGGQDGISGSDLRSVYFDASGNLVESGTVPSGTWKNYHSGTVADDVTREFVRTA